jgi:hypothetical protein
VNRRKGRWGIWTAALAIGLAIFAITAFSYLSFVFVPLSIGILNETNEEVSVSIRIADFDDIVYERSFVVNPHETVLEENIMLRVRGHTLWAETPDGRNLETRFDHGPQPTVFHLRVLENVIEGSLDP